MKQRKWRLPTDSKHYKKGRFENLSETHMMAKGVSYTRVLMDMLQRPRSVAPSSPLPSVRTSLQTLAGDTPIIVWFGHSSYLIHVKGFNVLVDPVFSGHASPLSQLVKAFPGANVYGVDDMPAIDLLIITHDHYDHLDSATVRRLGSRIKQVITPLGVGVEIAQMIREEVPVTEMDWWEQVPLSETITVTATPARHFSGRGLRRSGSLWASFVLEIEGFKLYLGSDSGYDTHFKQIGEALGPFDLALLECGQYNLSWPNIHMMPEETPQAAVDLGARWLLPVHWGKFTLANHPWNEPIQRVTTAAAALGVSITTPMIGEPVILDHRYPDSHWWET